MTTKSPPNAPAEPAKTDKPARELNEKALDHASGGFTPEQLAKRGKGG